MRKFYQLLLAILLLPFISNAQVPNCNADFTKTVSPTGLALFVPVIADTFNFQHHWSFGDGGTSTSVPATHQYSSAGTYTVRHIISRYANGAVVCRDTAYNSVVIQFACNLNANFVATAVPGAVGTFNFTNTTIGLLPTDSVRWTFGDGTTSVNAQSVTHTFTTPGTYRVCLRVKRNSSNSTTPCVSEICNTIVVAAPTACNLQASFIPHPDTSNWHNVLFSNTTLNILPTDSVRWNFGNGVIRNVVGPSMQTMSYANAGTYTVCIRVKRTVANSTTPCVSEFCLPVVVATPPPVCNVQASFIPHRDSINRLQFTFSNTTLNILPTDSVRWNFGNGVIRNVVGGGAQSITYANTGTYTVCIRVKRIVASSNTPCVSEFCLPVTAIGPTPNTCNIQAGFSTQVNLANPLSVYFISNSINASAMDTVRWTFGDGTSGTGNAVSHTYSTPGTYRVCIRVSRTVPSGAAPCVVEYCRTITVTGPTTSTCPTQIGFQSYADSARPWIRNFVNTSAYVPGAIATWSFGDSTARFTGWNATHAYANSGNYRVCLKIQYPNGCVREYCQIISIYQANSVRCTLQPWPNPVRNVVNVNVTLTQNMTIYTRVYNSQNMIVAQLQQSGATGQNTVSVNLSNNPAGIYRIVVHYGSRECRANFLKL